MLNSDSKHFQELVDVRWGIDHNCQQGWVPFWSKHVIDWEAHIFLYITFAQNWVKVHSGTFWRMTITITYAELHWIRCSD